ncbi:MAG: hypothetical protein KAU20_07890 [Nanoarchaeota archaeon]|nr:hypothetical protein [Nanoarchaeota archaeon]
MVMVFPGTKNSYSMDGYMKKNLDTAKRIIKKDWDMIFIYDGAEGSGKSTKAIQDAFYFDPTLDNDRVVFTPKEFREAIMTAKPYQAVIYDEAYTGLSSRATMSLINRTLISMLAEIRQRNLFVCVVMPTFFDLDKYVALWRGRALIHVYTKDFQRGRFAFYNADKKKKLYIYGKKFYDYTNTSPNFRGRFTSYMPIDEEAYKKKKRDSLIAREKKAEEAEKTKEIEAAMFERVMHMSEKIPHKVKMELLGMPASTYFVKLKTWKEQSELEA